MIRGMVNPFIVAETVAIAEDTAGIMSRLGKDGIPCGFIFLNYRKNIALIETRSLFGTNRFKTPQSH